MVWFKVDDTFALHPKALAAGNCALGLWVRAGAWCSQQLTGGFVPEAVIPTLGGRTKDAQALVDAGLWDKEPGGYRFHQWDERQPTKESVEADRAAARERQRKARERAREARESRVTSTEVTQAVTDTVTVPPTRPDPTRPKEEEQEPAAKPRRARAIDPTSFELSDGMRTWARNECGSVDVDRETAKFLDHFTASGKPAKDWVAAWRNWIRRAAESGPRALVPAQQRPLRAVPSTTDQRVAEGLALARRLQEDGQ